MNSAEDPLGAGSHGMPEDRVIVFTRFPVPGTAKTRLIPTLGADGAAELQRRMAVQTVVTARRLSHRQPIAIEIRFDGGDIGRMQRWLGADLLYLPQGPGDLGARMLRAFEEASHKGARRVVLIGTDCPGLSPDRLHRTVAEAAVHDLVLGPATDGGYYLLAASRPIPELFSDIPWGTDSVLARTLEIANRLGLSVALLDPLTDVDRSEDLPAWESVQHRQINAAGSPRLSVIIPTLNEARHIAKTLAALEPVHSTEVIVADGKSSDGTREIAESYGGRVLETSRGRGAQMNAGAAAAQAEILLFVHADTLLPARFDERVVETLRNPGIVAGAFSLGIADASPALRWIAWTANLRSRVLQKPYGDQGLFLRAETFRRAGGFPPVPILEDVLLVRALGRMGRIVTLPERAVTSSRRWKQHGVLRTTLLHRAILMGYTLGVSPEKLARWRERN